MKTWKALSLTIIAFTAGLYLSEPIKKIFPKKQCIAQEGFYKNPYNLKITYLERQSKVETYLLDTKTREYKKIGQDIMKEKKNNLEKKIKILLHLYNLLGI